MSEQQSWKYKRDGDYWFIEGSPFEGKDNGEVPEESYILASAAPDMLEALELVKHDDPALGDAIWQVILNAIAKAKGGTQ